MHVVPNYFLIVAAGLSALAGLLHLGCIVFGASWYRFFGAGEKMASLVEAGSLYPTRMTLAIATVLFLWSALALSGAGVIPRIPYLRLALPLIAAAYLLRGVAYAPLMRVIPSNSLAFWLWSGAICVLIGIIHVVGIIKAWPHL